MSSPFSSAREFKQVMDELFGLMSEDPQTETLEPHYPYLVV